MAVGAWGVGLGSGDISDRVVHAAVLAEAVLVGVMRRGPECYNIGCRECGNMRETLLALVDHAGTGSHVVTLPSKPAAMAICLENCGDWAR